MIYYTGMLGHLGITTPQTQAWLLAAGLLLLLLVLGFIITVFFLWFVFRKGRPVWRFLGSVAVSLGKAVRDNPDVRELKEQYPRASSFIGARFKRGTFTGWPATLLFLAFLYALLLFIGSIEDFVRSGLIVAADNRIANILYVFRTPGLTGVFLWVTLLGKSQVVTAFVLATSAFLLVRDQVPYIMGLWTSVLGGALFSYLGKLAFHRPRPQVALYLESTWSFPSGHATVAVAFYGFLIFLLWRQAKGWGVRILGSAGLITTIGAIGFSRLYLGVHYLSDVWSGYLLGLLWMITGMSLAEAFRFRFHEGWSIPQKLESCRRPASLAIMGSALAFYVLTGVSYDPPKAPREKKPPAVWSGDVLTSFGKGELSPFSETIIGTPQEPVSFVIHASGPEQLVETFSAAGWTLAQQHGISNLVLAGRAALFNLTDTTAPMTPSFWNGKPHDFGFEKPVTGKGLRQRHHARFWATALVGPDQRPYFVGTASLDMGMKWFITHIIQPDIDTEREFLFRDLISTGKVESWRKRDLVGPHLGKNFAGDPFFTDGKVYILELF